MSNRPTVQEQLVTLVGLQENHLNSMKLLLHSLSPSIPKSLSDTQIREAHEVLDIGHSSSETTPENVTSRIVTYMLAYEERWKGITGNEDKIPMLTARGLKGFIHAEQMDKNIFYRAIATLTEQGYLVREKRGWYQLGPKARKGMRAA